MIINFEAFLPELCDKAKLIQRGGMIGSKEAENLILKINLLRASYLHKRDKAERQYRRKVQVIDAKIQLIENVHKLFICCLKDSLGG